MANKPMKKYSTSLVTRETHIKTTMRYHLTPSRMTRVRKSDNNQGWSGWEAIKALTRLMGMESGGKQSAVPQTVKHKVIT